MNTTNDRIIIGIDPGTNVMGYGVLRIVGNTPELMTLGELTQRAWEHDVQVMIEGPGHIPFGS